MIVKQGKPEMCNYACAKCKQSGQLNGKWTCIYMVLFQSNDHSERFTFV